VRDQRGARAAVHAPSRCQLRRCGVSGRGGGSACRDRQRAAEAGDHLMYPDIFQLAKNSAAVTTLLGSNPVRFWPFGTAPQGEDRPYAVHQLVYGTPSNTLSCPPSEDLLGVQVDCYAKSVSSARSVAAALRDAIEDDYNH